MKNLLIIKSNSKSSFDNLELTLPYWKRKESILIDCSGVIFASILNRFNHLSDSGPWNIFKTKGDDFGTYPIQQSLIILYI